MRAFNYSKLAEQMLNPEIVQYLNFIHEQKGKQALFIEQSSEELKKLVDLAIIQSTESSNRIEGIQTTDKRLKELVKQKTKPKNRSEQEIAGYRAVLSTIHESYDYIPITPNIILQFHRDLYIYSSKEPGGHYKNADNLITEKDADGHERIRFKPVSASQTREYIERLCDEFNKVRKEGRHDPLILIPMFILDFLCIHPFNDGNGRMSRLLTLLLMYQSGYIVGKYLSIEMIIEKTKQGYYETLQQSSINWHDATNNYEPFVKYYLSIIKKVYTEFESRIQHIRVKTVSKADRVKLIIDQHIGKITKNDIAQLAPDISMITIERSLKLLLDKGYIVKKGAGRATFYVKSDALPIEK